MKSGGRSYEFPLRFCFLLLGLNTGKRKTNLDTVDLLLPVDGKMTFAACSDVKRRILLRDGLGRYCNIRYLQ